MVSKGGDKINPYGLGSDHRAGDDWSGDATFWRDDFNSSSSDAAKTGPRFTRTLNQAALQTALDALVNSIPTSGVEAKIGCHDCGQDHVRDGKRTCNAHSRRAKPVRPCRNFPPQGVTVCRFHGGAAPQVAGKAERRIIEGVLHDALTTHVAAHPGSPITLLPERKPKKGGHKRPNSTSARRARLRCETFRRDEQLDDGDGGHGQQASR